MFKKLSVPSLRRAQRQAPALEAGAVEAGRHEPGLTHFEVQADGVVLAFGLAWHPLDGLGPQEVQAKKLAGKFGAKRYTIVRHAKSSIEPEAGLLSKTAKLPKQKVIEAAAAAFALAVRENTAMYLAPGPAPGTYLLIGLLSGMPSPEFDIVGSADEVLSAADHYQTYLTQGATLYAHEALSGGGGASHVDEGIEEFIRRNSVVVRVVPSIPYASTAGKQSGGAMVAVGSSQLVVMGGLVFLGIIGLAGAFMFYQDWAAKNSELAKTKALNAAALTSYMNSRNTAFNSEGVQLAVPATEKLWESVQSQPTLRNGWRVSTITCTAGVCEAEFNRSRASTFQTFSEASKDGETPLMALAKLDSASAKFAIPSWQEIPQLDLEKVSVSDVTVPLGTQAQLMVLAGMSVEVKPAVPLGDSVLVTARKVPVKKFKVGNWSITGPVDTLLPAVARLPSNATLSKLVVNVVDSEVSFVATGRYFISAN
jgi:hypothetical protein